MNLPVPKIFVTADQVENGKPDPQGKELYSPIKFKILTTNTGYRMARQLLNIPADAPVLVVEDAPAGVQAGIAAGCDVLGLLTTHTRDQIIDAGATFIVDDLASVEFEEGNEDGLRIRINAKLEDELLN